LTARKFTDDLMVMALEFLPLVVFFVMNRLSGIYQATAVFMVATAICVGVSIWLTRAVSPLLVFNTAMVAVFGGLTLVLHDSLFVKLKPTVDYAMFASVLLFGLAKDRLFLKTALGITFPGLHDLAWRVITRNWALFFFAMAIANEVVWRSTDTDTWVTYRVWVPPASTLLFGLIHIPYLMRDEDDADESIQR
jgi:intracellular septation protein